MNLGANSYVMKRLCAVAVIVVCFIYGLLIGFHGLLNSVNFISYKEDNTVNSSNLNNNSSDEFPEFKMKMFSTAHIVTTNRTTATINDKLFDQLKNYKDTSPRHIWPNKNEQDDRILHQLRTLPNVNKSLPIKLIYTVHGIENGKPAGQKQFLDLECPVNWCSLTEDKNERNRADLVIYTDSMDEDVICKSSGGKNCLNVNKKQIVMLLTRESPIHTRQYGIGVNWTATYRNDSTIVYPYRKFVYFNNFTKLPEKAFKNFALGKTKKVAWFVSNCGAANGRDEYVKELAKYIEVDIFGRCGSKKCGEEYDPNCYKMLRDEYKFYLAFENFHCKEYITEKFFRNALSYDILPIVMGARPEDYKNVAPPESYIHVDDFDSPKDLADYLHKLDRNDDLYNKYFRWKGTGELIDPKFWCRVCTILHERDTSGVKMWYHDLNEWWRKKGTCVTISDGPLRWASWKYYKGPTSNVSHTFNYLSYPDSI